MDKKNTAMGKNYCAIVLAAGFIVALALAGYFIVGFTGMLFSVAFMGGFILWLFTTYRIPVDPNTVLAPYLVTVIFFIIHVYEEYMAHVEVTLTKMSGVQVSQDQFLIIAAFAAPVVWLFGILLTLKRRPFGYFLFSTFLFGMMIAELSHFFSPLTENGSYYSPGMYTAILPIGAGWYTFWKVLCEIKKVKRVSHPANHS